MRETQSLFQVVRVAPKKAKKQFDFGNRRGF